VKHDPALLIRRSLRIVSRNSPQVDSGIQQTEQIASLFRQLAKEQKAGHYLWYPGCEFSSIDSQRSLYFFGTSTEARVVD